MLKKKSFRFASILLFFSLILAGFQIARGVSVNFAIEQSPIINGVITSGEYSSSKSFGTNYKLYWEVTDSTSISIGIEAKTTGWVSLGIKPSSRMKDADMIYGWVEDNGTVVVYDAFSLSSTGDNHPPDTEIGGTFDFLSYNGSENTTSTTIEITRLLSTGDLDYDNSFPSNGEIAVIWAYGADDNFHSYHSARGSSIIMITSTPQNTDSLTTQDEPTTVTDGSTPGFQGLLLIVGIIVTIWVKRKK